MMGPMFLVGVLIGFVLGTLLSMAFVIWYYLKLFLPQEQKFKEREERIERRLRQGARQFDSREPL